MRLYPGIRCDASGGLEGVFFIVFEGEIDYQGVMQARRPTGRFEFSPPPLEPHGTVLYNYHIKRLDFSRLVAFAGYLMPVWYSSIRQEHQAVRVQAGLFDCTHMGVLEFSGPGAAAFLEAMTTNCVGHLAVGQAHYSYLLDASGGILDDIIVYRLGGEKFMVVVNAANEPKVWAYLEALRLGHVAIDPEHPQRQLPAFPSIRDLRQGAGAEGRVDIAIQGPASGGILASLLDDPADRQRLAELKRFTFASFGVSQTEVLIARTGYTGAKVGYEVFVAPEKAGAMWEALLAAGSDLGLQACGLGARDSLRIEAGLPLYGHELAGDYDISPFAAGYGWAVKLDKDFFIGQAAMRQKAPDPLKVIARLTLPGQKGVRPVRPHDAVLDERGGCIGWITSCAHVEETQFALAYMDSPAAVPESPVGIYYLARHTRQTEQGRKASVADGETVSVDLEGVVRDRFARF